MSAWSVVAALCAILAVVVACLPVALALQALGTLRDAREASAERREIMADAMRAALARREARTKQPASPERSRDYLSRTVGSRKS